MRLKKRQSFSSSLLACTLSNGSLCFRVTLGLISIIFFEKKSEIINLSYWPSNRFGMGFILVFVLYTLFPLSQSQHRLYLNCTDDTLFAGYIKRAFISLTLSKHFHGGQEREWCGWHIAQKTLFAPKLHPNLISERWVRSVAAQLFVTSCCSTSHYGLQKRTQQECHINQSQFFLRFFYKRDEKWDRGLWYSNKWACRGCAIIVMMYDTFSFIFSAMWLIGSSIHFQMDEVGLITKLGLGIIDLSLKI